MSESCSEEEQNEVPAFTFQAMPPNTEIECAHLNHGSEMDFVDDENGNMNTEPVSSSEEEDGNKPH